MIDIVSRGASWPIVLDPRRKSILPVAPSVCCAGSGDCPLRPAASAFCGFLRKICSSAWTASGASPEFANCCRKFCAEAVSFSARTRSSCFIFVRFTCWLNAPSLSSASLSLLLACATSSMVCVSTELSSTLCSNASCRRTQYSSWQKNLASCEKRWWCSSLSTTSNCCINSVTSCRSRFSSASRSFRYLSCSSASAFSLSWNSLRARSCSSVISSSGIWSIHGSRSRVISNAERSFLVLSVPPIIWLRARVPASFSRSWRRRSSSFAFASSIFFCSSGEIHFSTEISLSFTCSTASASSVSCSWGSGTSSSTCNSARMDRIRAVFSRIWSMMLLLSPWHVLKTSLKAARYSAATAWRRWT
mmetsp:Transcript_10797/g.27823  ORF Transcript_10797/g.27823 Transcript_10797/m.27823 type:complete len:361 (-) Transcript_10797:2998-4080(-)